MRKSICLAILCSLISCVIQAQGSFDDFKKKVEREYTSFRKAKENDFKDFRDKINAEYASLIKKAWKEFNAIDGIPMPVEDKLVPPIVYPDWDRDKPIEDRPRPFEEIVPIVKPEPQPEPIVPIEETPEPSIEHYYTFKFFNTVLKVRLEDTHRFVLRKCNEEEIARIWKVLSNAKYNNVIKDCLSIRSQRNLCDWAYLLMLRDLSNAFFRGYDNEAALFTAFLYCQSGYKIRLAMGNNQLFLLYASQHKIYDKYYWEVDGEKFYPLDCNLKQLHICQVTFPKERPLSLQIGTEQLFAVNISERHSLQSRRYPNMKADVNINKNLIEFFSSYPTSIINEDIGTRWVMYANTPISREIKESLYPLLENSVSGKSQMEAVNCLLNFVQTAFNYEYDEKVWGNDRAFFADETLYYPYSDCEDRAILFSRLIRDLLGLKTVLIYYPGHLATAVNFTDNVTGDYLEVNNRRYVICDPTYIGAPVGATMPNMDNSNAKVILLE